MTGEYRAHLDEAMRVMREFVDTTGCRRRFLLQHFGEGYPGDATTSCKSCDNCMNRDNAGDGGIVKRDFTKEARVLAGAVRDTKESCGVATVCKILTASQVCMRQPCLAVTPPRSHHTTSQASNVRKWAGVSSYGAGKGHRQDWWRAFARLATVMRVVATATRSFGGGGGGGASRARTYSAMVLGPTGRALLTIPGVRLLLSVAGCVGVWVCGCVDVWICGCVGVWMCGYVDMWMCG